MYIYSIRTIGIFLCFLMAASFAKAQEKIYPLQYNAVIDAYIHCPENASQKKRSKHGLPHTQYLPFFDDFSKSSVYPNDTLWLDNNVFINNTFGIEPPSTGVATFDGLNAEGRPYSQNDNNSDSKGTDTLTSTYIDLSSFSDGDSIYLSFFYQPTGLGDLTESGDSLILEFHPDSLLNDGVWDDSAWVQIWAVGGSATHPFRQVMIPIRQMTSPNYFHKKFQFRLSSLGHRSGNLDNWHVDYIYVNRGRTQQDTAYEDVAIYKPSGSILKNYYSMPLRQFQAGGNANLIEDIPIYSKNNSGKIKNVTFGYDIVNKEDGQVLATFFNTQGDNLDAFANNKFELATKLNSGGLNNRKTTLLVNTAVSNIPDDFRINDTATHKQVFDDYIAYDDGTAEGGYGLTGTTYGKVALRFSLNTPDTLHGIGIYFNQSEAYVGGNSITLAVWKNITPPGQPETDDPDARIAYVKPQYDGFGKYAYFELKEPMLIQNDFYIGWIQNRSFNVNIGYDKNYSELQGNTSANLFYSVTGKWQATSLTGIPMIRAYVGSKPVFIGMEEKVRNEELNVSIFPNPNNGHFNIQLPEKNGDYEIAVFDVAGKMQGKIIRTNQSANISLPNLKPGIYITKVTDTKTGKSAVKRISVLRN